MIEINFDHLNWNDLSDEEQITLCKAVANDYNRISKPIYLIMHDDQYAGILSKQGGQFEHDWNRMCWNLNNISHPQRLDENLSVLRWQTIYKLYEISSFLEWLGKKLSISGDCSVIDDNV